MYTPGGQEGSLNRSYPAPKVVSTEQPSHCTSYLKARVLANAPSPVLVSGQLFISTSRVFCFQDPLPLLYSEPQLKAHSLNESGPPEGSRSQHSLILTLSQRVAAVTGNN